MQVARFIPSRSVALVAVLLVVALIAAAWLGLQPQTPIAEDASTSAEFKHGVLTLRIPKAAHVQPRRIEVKAG